jgi:hypothetical protein
MGDLSDFERGYNIGERLAGASMIKLHIIRCIESDVSKVMSAYTNSWEDNISEEEQWAKMNIDRKRSSYIEKERFEISRNYCSTSDRTAELNMNFEDPANQQYFLIKWLVEYFNALS